MIKDKVVVIAGASSGIGEATAKLLAGKGAKVVLAARREEKLKSLAEEIQAAGGQAVCRVTDVTVADDNAEFAGVRSEDGGMESDGGRQHQRGPQWGGRRNAHLLGAKERSHRMASASEGTNIRTATIYPAAINTELLNTISHDGVAWLVHRIQRP